MKEWNTEIPYSLSQNLISWAIGIVASLGLFYTISLSLKEELPVEETETSLASQSVRLSPPPPPEILQQTEEPKTAIAEKVQFNLTPDNLAIKLLATNIRPTHAKDIIQKVDFDLSKFEVKGKDIDDMVVYEGREVDRRPEYIYRTMPKVKAENLEEIVRLIYVINRDGSVGDIYVLESTNPAINEDVTRSVKTWTYSPAIKGGKKVRCWVKQKIVIKKTTSLFSVN
jgi:hypothetical protein